MNKIIKFERFKDVTDWSLEQIRQYVRDNHWPGLRFHLPPVAGGPVRIERLPEGKS